MAIEMVRFKTRDEWLKHRKRGLGGSEISAVIGCNPYMDNVALWELKTGRREAEDISSKPYVQYGTQAERHLRGLFRLDFPQYKVGYVENNSFHNDKYPWAAASLDGWLTDPDGRRGVLEIKTSDVLSSMHKERWREQIPQNYYCQVLFYMAVIEADFAVLKAQLRTEFDGLPYFQTKHYQFERADVQGDIDYLMAEGAAFWNDYVMRDQRPPLRLPEI